MPGVRLQDPHEGASRHRAGELPAVLPEVPSRDRGELGDGGRSDRPSVRTRARLRRARRASARTAARAPWRRVLPRAMRRPSALLGFRSAHGREGVAGATGASRPRLGGKAPPKWRKITDFGNPLPNEAAKRLIAKIREPRSGAKQRKAARRASEIGDFLPSRTPRLRGSPRPAVPAVRRDGEPHKSQTH